MEILSYIFTILVSRIVIMFWPTCCTIGPAPILAIGIALFMFAYYLYARFAFNETNNKFQGKIDEIDNKIANINAAFQEKITELDDKIVKLIALQEKIDESHRDEIADLNNMFQEKITLLSEMLCDEIYEIVNKIYAKIDEQLQEKTEDFDDKITKLTDLSVKIQNMQSSVKYLHLKLNNSHWTKYG